MNSTKYSIPGGQKGNNRTMFPMLNQVHQNTMKNVPQVFQRNAMQQPQMAAQSARQLSIAPTEETSDDSEEEEEESEEERTPTPKKRRRKDSRRRNRKKPKRQHKPRRHYKYISDISIYNFREEDTSDEEVKEFNQKFRKMLKRNPNDYWEKHEELEDLKYK